METNTTANSTSQTQSFEIDAQQVIASVRNAFAAILDSLPGHVARAHEVSKAFGVHKKLGWQIANVVYEPNLFAAAHHIPGATSVKRFLDAAAERRVNRELIACAEEAVSGFQQLIETHAGDRESLHMMLATSADESSQDERIELRRLAFVGNSSIWGVQAKAQLRAHFLHPGTRDGWLDVASIRGFVGFQRLRRDVPWLVTRMRVDNDTDAPRQQPERAPLDPGAAQEHEGQGVPLLRPFCSQPLPQFRRTVTPDGFVQDELLGGPIGRTAAIDCFTGEICRNLGSYYRDERNWLWRVRARMRTPCRVLIVDQFVHEEVFGPIQPELCVYSELTQGAEGLHTEQLEGNRLPITGSVLDLGYGTGAIHTPEVRRYAEMVGYVFDRLQWEAKRFRVYRVRLEFPPIPTSVGMVSPLPERPAAPVRE
jgi:hypothetical protein